MRELAGTRQQRYSPAQLAETLPVNTIAPQKKPRLYAVTPLEVPIDPIDVVEPIEVGPKLVQVFKPRPISAGKATHQLTSGASHQLTTEEFVAVRVATVRESTRHCFWPTDVLEKFLAAEVITTREQ